MASTHLASGNEELALLRNQVLILVDEYDKCVGYASRDECHTGNGKLHRAIAVLLFNKDKKLLLQKRKSLLWNNFWDISGATHPQHYPDYDESYEDAARRCLKTEWNIAASVQRIFSFTYFERFNEFCESEYCVLMAGEHNGEASANPDYAHDKRWAGLEECKLEIRQNPSIYTPWARIAIENLSLHPFSRGRSSTLEVADTGMALSPAQREFRAQWT